MAARHIRGSEKATNEEAGRISGTAREAANYWGPLGAGNGVVGKQEPREGALRGSISADGRSGFGAPKQTKERRPRA
ncbi:hypothetical protein NDU88_003709 [Pleurodeles waltl]|uniref:Uncharacterized protein n=1 Tax=Pleurodeles waltl TaxID=8319 RepID=A0AAV7UZ66_PLEWA|nr:hypothetical protein NDU88_003709 [Pleurodeles waltl]